MLMLIVNRNGLLAPYIVRASDKRRHVTVSGEVVSRFICEADTARTILVGHRHQYSYTVYTIGERP